MGRVPAFSMRSDDCRTVLTGGNGSFPFMLMLADLRRKPRMTTS